MHHRIKAVGGEQARQHGPVGQIAHDQLSSQYGIPVEVIPQSVYGSLDGNGLIDFALDVLNKS